MYGFSLPVVNFLAGLGGRDVSEADVRLMYDRLLEAAKDGKAKRDVVWIGTRGVEP